MLSIPEIATRLVDETLTKVSEDNSCTICFVGSSSVVSFLSCLYTLHYMYRRASQIQTSFYMDLYTVISRIILTG